MRFSCNPEYKIGSPHFEVKRSSIHGLGLFAKKTFLKNEIITFYDGVHIGLAEAIEKKARGQGLYLKTISHFHDIIDGLRTPMLGRGAGSFCNHSWNPNARLWVRNDDCWIQAITDIQPNSEITVSYGKKYWR